MSVKKSALVCAASLVMGSVLVPGCSRVISARIAVYEGREPGYQVMKAEELKSLHAEPIKEVKVLLSKDRGPWRSALKQSPEPGRYFKSFGKPPPGCGGYSKETKQTQVDFKCRKDGYSTVKGSFTLGEFMAEGEKRVLVVRMKPVEDEAEQEPESDTAEKGEQK